MEFLWYAILNNHSNGCFVEGTSYWHPGQLIMHPGFWNVYPIPTIHCFLTAISIYLVITRIDDWRQGTYFERQGKTYLEFSCEEICYNCSEAGKKWGKEHTDIPHINSQVEKVHGMVDYGRGHH